MTIRAEHIGNVWCPLLATYSGNSTSGLKKHKKSNTCGGHKSQNFGKLNGDNEMSTSSALPPLPPTPTPTPQLTPTAPLLCLNRNTGSSNTTRRATSTTQASVPKSIQVAAITWSDKKFITMGTSAIVRSIEVKDAEEVTSDDDNHDTDNSHPPAHLGQSCYLLNEQQLQFMPVWWLLRTSSLVNSLPQSISLGLAAVVAANEGVQEQHHNACCFCGALLSPTPACCFHCGCGGRNKPNEFEFESQSLLHVSQNFRTTDLECLIALTTAMFCDHKAKHDDDEHKDYEEVGHCGRACGVGQYGKSGQQFSTDFDFSYVLSAAASMTSLRLQSQMLLKWLVSSLQTGVGGANSNNGGGNSNAKSNEGMNTNNNKCNNLSEQEIHVVTMQYCNNLLHVGVLKPISEKANDTFSPFEMYQWAHNAMQFAALPPPPTPGKLDKTHGVWPYSSTPQSIMKATTKSTQTDGGVAFLEVLRKRLLSCQSMSDVQAVIDELLPIGAELQRRPSKRCLQITELLDASEATIYEYNTLIGNNNSSNNRINAQAKQEERKTQTRNAATQHEAGSVELMCCTCGGKKERQQEQQTDIKYLGVDVAIQTDNFDDIKKPKTSTKSSIPPPPPPPMPPMLSPAVSTILQRPSPTPPPPPPPPPTPSQLTTLNVAQDVSSKASTPSVSPIPPPPPPPALQSASKANVNTTQGTPTRSPANTSVPSPSPLPALPSDSSFFIAKNALRKTAVNPPKPMRPLYWTRIITPAAPPKPTAPTPPPVETPTESATDSSAGSSPDDLPMDTIVPTAAATMKEIWQEIDETKIDNLDEFTELFSRQAVAPPIKLVKPKPERVRTVKVLDAKRSQNVGIVARTLHVDFSEIEHAIYNLDSSVVSLETLQHIVHMKATDQELEQIKEAAKDDLPLDLPEQFLLKLSQISMSTERISCIVFQTEFEDAATIVTRKLEVIFSVSKFLIESEDLKILFSIILTLGNYMNGGNVQRGQADGFTLEILNKLKDVKSQQSQITLLHFIVRTYINHRRKAGLQLLEIPFPIPEPSEIERAMLVDFTETNRQINELNNKLNACRKTTEAVLLASTPETVEPFKTKMESVMDDALKTVDKLTKQLAACRALFVDAMRFYQFKPKTGTVETCTPAQFFEYWTHFTNDFRDIWKREIAMICDALIKKSKQLEKEARKNVKTTKAKPGGLKERMLRLRNQDQRK